MRQWRAVYKFEYLPSEYFLIDFVIKYMNKHSYLNCGHYGVINDLGSSPQPSGSPRAALSFTGRQLLHNDLNLGISSYDLRLQKQVTR